MVLIDSPGFASTVVMILLCTNLTYLDSLLINVLQIIFFFYLLFF